MYITIIIHWFSYNVRPTPTTLFIASSFSASLLLSNICFRSSCLKAKAREMYQTQKEKIGGFVSCQLAGTDRLWTCVTCKSPTDSMATYSSELEWSHPDYYNESEKKPMLSQCLPWNLERNQSIVSLKDKMHTNDQKMLTWSSTLMWYNHINWSKQINSYNH